MFAEEEDGREGEIRRRRGSEGQRRRKEISHWGREGGNRSRKGRRIQVIGRGRGEGRKGNRGAE